MTTLVIVDVQNDFCPGGSMAAPRGADVAAKLKDFLNANAGSYDHVVATQDWHIDPGSHWSDDPDFQDSWPVHCPAGEPGAQLHPLVPTAPIEARFKKGMYDAAYSGFEGRLDGEEDGALLGDWLRERGVTDIDVCGIATDFCVNATVGDALEQGFTVRVLSDLSAPIDEDGAKAKLEALAGRGATIVEDSATL